MNMCMWALFREQRHDFFFLCAVNAPPQSPTLCSNLPSRLKSIGIIGAGVG